MKIYTRKEKEELRKLREKVDSISVAEIADNLYGLTLYQSSPYTGDNLRCKEHQSLLFDMERNAVCGYATNLGRMNVYDFVAYYEQISHLSARQKVNEYFLERDPRVLDLYYYNKKTRQTIKHSGVLIPEADTKDDIVRDFLQSEPYKLPNEIVDTMIRDSNIFQDKEGNIAFLGFDERNKPAFALTYDKDTMEFTECNGSYTKVGFSFKQDKSHTLVICDDVLKGLEILSVTPNVDILCAKDNESIKDTITYAFKNMNVLENKNSVEFVLENSYEIESLVGLVPKKIVSITSINNYKDSNDVILTGAETLFHLYRENSYESHYRNDDFIRTFDDRYFLYSYNERGKWKERYIEEITEESAIVLYEGYAEKSNMKNEEWYKKVIAKYENEKSKELDGNVLE